MYTGFSSLLGTDEKIRPWEGKQFILGHITSPLDRRNGVAWYNENPGILIPWFSFNYIRQHPYKCKHIQSNKSCQFFKVHMSPQAPVNPRQLFLKKWFKSNAINQRGFKAGMGGEEDGKSRADSQNRKSELEGTLEHRTKNLRNHHFHYLILANRCRNWGTERESDSYRVVKQEPEAEYRFSASMSSYIQIYLFQKFLRLADRIP